MTVTAHRPRVESAIPDSALGGLAALQARWAARPRSGTMGLIIPVLATLGMLAIWLVAYALVISGVQESRAQSQLYAELRENLAGATTPIGGVIAAGTPIALLSVPDADVHNVVISEGTDARTLRNGPGHLRDTPLPGQVGVSAVFGRGTMFGAPFRHIGELKDGDLVKVTTGQGAYSFKVLDVRRAGDPLPPAPATGSARITLVSAEGHGLSALAPDRTVFVDADLHGTAVQAPAGRPTTVPTNDLPMRGDSSATYALVLWLQGLLLVTVGVLWAWFRWGRRQALVVGAPVVLAALWGVTETAAALLPNLA